MAWRIRLEGERMLLDDLCSVVRYQNLRVVKEEVEGYVSHYLEGSYFDDLAIFEEVEEHAKHVLQVLSGVARTFGCDLPLKAVLITRRDDGHEVSRTVDPTVTLLKALTIAMYEGLSESPPRNFYRVFEGALLDRRVGDVYRLLASGDGWYALYKVYEVIGGKLIARERWAPKEELDRFTHNANFFYRHPGEYTGWQRPADPMPLWEATRMMFRIVNSWVRQRIGGDAGGPERSRAQPKD